MQLDGGHHGKQTVSFHEVGGDTSHRKKRSQSTPSLVADYQALTNALLNEPPPKWGWTLLIRSETQTHTNPFRRFVDKSPGQLHNETLDPAAACIKLRS